MSASSRVRAAPSSAPTDPADRSATSRTAILDAARRLFATSGYASTSVADIVKEAGTSVGLPYYHFGNKRNIFVAIWTQYQQEQQARTGRAVEQARRGGAPGPQQFLAGVRAYLEGAWQNRDLVPVMHGPGRPAGFDQTVEQGAGRWTRQIIALLPGYESATARLAILMLNEGLSATCVDVATCGSRNEADRSIARVVTVIGRLLENLPPSGPGKSASGSVEPGNRPQPEKSFLYTIARPVWLRPSMGVK